MDIYVLHFQLYLKLSGVFITFVDWFAGMTEAMPSQPGHQQWAGPGQWQGWGGRMCHCGFDWHAGMVGCWRS